MNKICTSIEQSKKLAEFLPLESADMCWTNHCYGVIRSSMTISAKTVDEYKSLLDRFNDSASIDVFYPAWSLNALMNFLPSEFTEVGKYSTTTYKIKIRKYKFTDEVDLYQIAYGNYTFHEDGNSSWKDMINTGEKENLIDAAFQMLVWLKENNKI